MFLSHSSRIFLSAALAVFLSSCLEHTQPPGDSKLPPSEQNAIGTDNDSYGLYNVNTVKTVSGEILEVKQVRMEYYGRRLDILLQCADGKILVHLGPADYMKKSGIELKKGDIVTVKGSETTFNRSVRLIAAEVIKNNQTYQLRSGRGMPLWPESGKELLKQPQLKLAE